MFVALYPQDAGADFRCKTAFEFQGQHSSVFHAFASGNLNDPEFYRLFVRDPKFKIEDPHYLPNTRDSVLNVFAPWFEDPTNLDYEDMISKQNIVVLLGSDGSSRYITPTMAENEEIVPGRFEDEDQNQITYLEFNLTEECRKFGCSFNPEDLMHRPEIEGIPNARVHGNRIQVISGTHGPETHIVHFYPNGTDRIPFRERAKKIMLELRTLPPGSKVSSWIDKLSDYFQLLIDAPPFPRANASVFMTHVNYFLMYQGLRGISHGALDYLAMTHSSNQFRKIFKAAVDTAQVQTKIDQNRH